MPSFLQSSSGRPAFYWTTTKRLSGFHPIMIESFSILSNFGASIGRKDSDAQWWMGHGLEYEDKCREELRWEDYQNGDRPLLLASSTASRFLYIVELKPVTTSGMYFHGARLSNYEAWRSLAAPNNFSTLPNSFDNVQPYATQNNVVAQCL